MSRLEKILLSHRSYFHPVVDLSGNEVIHKLDLSKSNKELTEFIYSDTESFSAYINKQRAHGNCRYLVGGYSERREMYKRSVLFNIVKYDLPEESVETAAQEPRRLHLGIDIWGDAGTKVYAPIGGMVHSFAYNDHFGDYGATIILQHQLETLPFHTLYGHLSQKDIAGLREGQVITRGQCFAHFGKPSENGNWPPHLHFQIIDDMEMKEGDYPGVCKESEKEKYLANCPDADLILNMMHRARE